MPFLIVLAVTGTIYCFQPQVEPLLYPHLLRVAPGSQRLPAQALLELAQAAVPTGATPTTYTVGTNARASAEFVFRLPSGKSESVYLNPYTGDALGSLSVEDRFMKQVRMLHRALLLGKPGELLMELAGCWCLVMIATGLALWWPRLRATGTAAFRMGRVAGKRGWWKELHQVLGAWLAVGALAFVLSGLPWTASWGKQFKALATAANLGRPASGGADSHSQAQAAPRTAGATDNEGKHDDHAGHTMEALPLAEVPWAVGLTRVPTGTAGQTSIGLDRVLAIMAAQGASAGCQVALPTSTVAVYTVSCFPSDPQHERTLHIDQYSGAIVKDIRYQDYGPVAKAVSYGTSLHMGRYFGVANQVACAGISLGLMALAITGCIMWLKRRPARSLAAPSYPPMLPPMRAWTVGIGLLGAVFPLMGATLLVVWLLDRWFARAAGIPVQTYDNTAT